MDEAGNAWITSTLNCLQRSLVPVLSDDPASTSCPDIQQMAFDSHPKCYTGDGTKNPSEPSICLLPVTKWTCVVGTIDLWDLVDPLGLKQAAEVAAICVKQ